MPTTFYDQAVLTYNPVVHYTCDDAAGTTLDDLSTNSINGTLSGTYTLLQPGLLAETSNSINFAGGVATIAGTSGLWDFNTFTLLAWISHDSHQDRQRILIRDFFGSTRPWAMYLNWNSGPANWNIQFEHQNDVSPGSPVLLNGPVLAPATTYFIAEVFDDTEMIIYVNGVDVASVPQTNNTVVSNNAVGVGGATGNATLRYFGDISRVTVLGAGLGPADIAYLYELGSNGTPPIDVGLTGSTPCSLTWEWTAPHADVVSYDVRVDGGATVNIGNVLTYTANSTLTPSTLHTLEVRAHTTGGAISAWSDPVDGTTDPAPIPVPVVDVETTNLITVSWPDVGCGATYQARIAAGSPVTAVSPHDFTGVFGGVYAIEVRSLINGGYSEWGLVYANVPITYPEPVIFPPDDPLCVPVSDLGQGTNTVEIQTQGGTRSLGSLPASMLSWSRKLDDLSETNVTIPVSSLSEECCGLLADAHTWGHELVVYRDGERVWEGPIVNITENATGVTIRALDVLGFMLRRAHRGRTNGAPVFAIDEAAYDVTAAFGLDAWDGADPNVLAYLEVMGAGTGPTTERDIAVLSAYYFDTLDQLGDAGVNFTTVGRRIVLWPDTLTLGRVPTLLPSQHMSSDVSVVEDGMALAERAIVTSDNGMYGTSTLPSFPTSDPFYGPVELLTNIPNLASTAACDSAADSIRAQNFPAPVRLVIPDGSTLTADAPYAIGDLVPGVLMPVSHLGRCRSVQADFILTSVTVTQTPDGETVQVSVSPVSASVETD